MGNFSKVAVIIKLCIVLATVQLSLARDSSRHRQGSGKNAAATGQLNAIESIKPIDVDRKEALDFAVDSIGNQTGAGFEDKVIIGISEWLAFREDVDISKFKQAYSRHVKEKCSQLKSTAAKQQRSSGLSTPSQSNLDRKLAACETLLRKEVECKIKTVVKSCGCKKNLKYRKSPLVVLLGAMGLVGAALAITLSPECCGGKKKGKHSDSDSDCEDCH